MTKLHNDFIKKILHKKKMYLVIIKFMFSTNDENTINEVYIY